MFVRVPFFQALAEAIFGNLGHHLHGPVNRRNQVYLDDLPEFFNGINIRLAGFLVDFDGQRITGDAGAGHADSDHAFFFGNVMKDFGPEIGIRGITDKGDGYCAPDIVVNTVGGELDVAVNIDHTDGLDATTGQFNTNRMTYTAGSTCNNSHLT